ncbi:MAG: phosphoglycerate dehydrogenase [Chloroflexota bacterium]|nr:phosphoglycerate dehydrogenase [Chloroflexota bacterium]MDE2940779.1 phosphoglycerate dehydrogenase [Chloroflexota bacterium]MDE3266961.1 phosphoglycerate dehydrogenase [Chloroflexota bacterium]
MPRMLVSDPLATEGLELLRTQGDVDVKLRMDPAELLTIIGEYDALVVRSETRVTAEVIEAGSRLQVIGRAGVGVDNIDVEAATRRGIPVVNAPTGNTIAAAEHTIAMMLALARNIPQAHESLRRGEWTRSAFTGVEVRNRVLGVIGLGKVGTEVSNRARGLQMRVLGYDPFVSPEHASMLGIELASLERIFEESDFICLHTPLTESTRGIIGENALSMMKPNVRILNVARGELVDEDALLKAVEEGRVAGAALDVFSKEPPHGSPLLDERRIIVTPHLGASTEEAQAEVAREVAEQVIAVLQGRSAMHTVNAPFVPPETQRVLTPFVDAGSYAGKLAAQLVTGQLQSVNLRYDGEIATHDTNLLRAACLVGILSPISDERVNLINANLHASQRGLRITEQKSPSAEEHGSLITVEMETTERKIAISAAQVRGETHIVRINDYWIDIVPTGGYMLIAHHQDRPGMIGAVGTITGKHDINIGFMEVGRLEPRGHATMIIGLDDPLPDSVLAEINSLPNMVQTVVVQL